MLIIITVVSSRDIVLCICTNDYLLERKAKANHGSLALDGAVVRKISKRRFFEDIKNFFHGVTQMGLESHQNFFQKFFQQIRLLEERKVFAY